VLWLLALVLTIGDQAAGVVRRGLNRGVGAAILGHGLGGDTRTSHQLRLIMIQIMGTVSRLGDRVSALVTNTVYQHGQCAESVFRLPVF